jgi:hypothetical protein
MALERRTQLYLFLGLLGVLAVVVAYNLGGAPELAVAFGIEGKYEPMKIPDPMLRLDLLDRIRELEYSGTHRNIFSATPPPPPEPKKPVAVAPTTPVPEAPPPLTVPYKFYGIVVDQKTGLRRACLTNGEDIFIVAEGGLLQGRFRVLKIGNLSLDIEEVSSGRRATVPLEALPGPQG